jgi:hypothetical protein
MLESERDRGGQEIDWPINILPVTRTLSQRVKKFQRTEL